MTRIEWTDETWNPVTGCTKVSAGCQHCYAERLWPKVEGAQAAREGRAPQRSFTDVRVHFDRFDAPLHWRKPRRVFVNSMSDLFHESVDDVHIAALFGVMAAAPQHTFQILTKRPQRMREWFQWIARDKEDPGEGCLRYTSQILGLDFLDRAPYDTPAWPLRNVHDGVSVEDQPTADERIPLLLETPAAIRFVSYEPALGPVDATPFLSTQHSALSTDPKLDWIIAGGESGPRARPPHPDWFRAVRDQCTAAGVPFFFKQWGEWAPPIAEDGVPPGAVEGRLYRVGKKAAGRLLDGREHSEYPQAVSGEERGESDD
jgi:protein gp37